jgi:hypothetical protein
MVDKSIGSLISGLGHHLTYLSRDSCEWRVKNLEYLKSGLRYTQSVKRTLMVSHGWAFKQTYFIR